MSILLFNSINNVNIYAYLEYTQNTTNTQTIEFNSSDSNKIIITLMDEHNNIIQQKTMFKDYSNYFSFLLPSNDASIKDLFNNELFYQSPSYVFTVIYDGITYSVNKVMNLGSNTIMLLEPLESLEPLEPLV
jgi:hypothetical protein